MPFCSGVLIPIASSPSWKVIGGRLWLHGVFYLASHTIPAGILPPVTKGHEQPLIITTVKFIPYKGCVDSWIRFQDWLHCATKEYGSDSTAILS